MPWVKNSFESTTWLKHRTHSCLEDQLKPNPVKITMIKLPPF